MSDSHQPTDSSRPDLEEAINVAQTHGVVLEDNAAVARERRVRENGLEPVSLWVIVSSAFVLLVAGGVLSTGGSLFNYGEFRAENYVQQLAPGGGDSGPITMPVIDAFSKNGAKIYAAKCQGCHQPNGMGDGANFPPLGNSEWVTGDTQHLAMIIMNGVKGEITVDGRVWNSAMAPQMPLSAVELASVMTYVRNSFGNETGDVVSAEMAEAALSLYKERAAGAALPPQMTEAELKADYSAMLPGEAMDPATVVDLETFEPVGEAGATE